MNPLPIPAKLLPLAEQVSNLQAPGEDLVTLHIYSPPLRRMKRFSITGARTEDWCPPVLAFTHGEGI